MLIPIFIGICLLSAFCALPFRSEAAVRTIAFVGSTVVAGLLFWIALPVLFGSPMISPLGWWFVDPFAALILLIIGFIQWTAVLVSLPYLQHELHEKVISFSHVRWYFFLLPLFVLSMVLTVISNNLGLMWVALEGTTLATTMLVAFYTNEGSLEAAWKYIVLCSVGISLGLLGVLLVFYAAISTGSLEAINGISWTSLRDIAGHLSPTTMRWAFIFIFIGYGAKVGLVPMHTWLPDAHGRTPSPMSAMLSGVLLNVALFAILRYKILVDGSIGGSAWTNTFFLVFGALSFLVPAAFILKQGNYKRLLAYSSIEHMGFTVFCFGLGTPGMLAGVIHLIGHALIKSMLFFGTGNIFLHWKSTKFEKIGTVVKDLPYTAVLFTLGILCLLAVPPSPLFLSEYLGLLAGIGKHPYLVVGLLAGGAIIFAGMIGRVMPMLFQRRPEEAVTKVTPERWGLSHSVMALHLVLALGLGVAFLTPSAQAFLAHIVSFIA